MLYYSHVTSDQSNESHDQTTQTTEPKVILISNNSTNTRLRPTKCSGQIRIQTRRRAELHYNSAQSGIQPIVLLVRLDPESDRANSSRAEKVRLRKQRNHSNHKRSS